MSRTLLPLLLGLLAAGACRRRSGDDPPAFEVPSSEMTAAGYRVAWGEHGFPASVSRAQRVRARVTFVNAGSEIWRGSVHFARYFVPAGAPLSQGRDAAPRILLKRPVAPGQSVTLERFEVEAPAQPGDYVLVFDLVNEMVAWFSDRGSPRLEVPVRVE
jgi:hypothetical protein